MSHFTCLVIGENPEAQLAPFHEFECTGDNDEYVQSVDRTDECREAYQEYLKENSSGDGTPAKSFLDFVQADYGVEVVLSGQQPAIEGNHKYGYIQLNDKGDVAQVIRRTNPNAKWDWYLLGGRWTGYFTLKPEYANRGRTGRPGIMTPEAAKGLADQAHKKMIDFVAMRADAEREAGEQYDKVIAALGGLPLPPRFADFRENFTMEIDGNTARFIDGAPIELVRSAYWKLPAVKKLQEAKLMPFSDDVADIYGCDRATFVKRASEGAFATYSVIKDGVFYEKGQMGWWGMASNEKAEDEWNAEFAKLIDSVQEDTLLSVYDLHI